MRAKAYELFTKIYVRICLCDSTRPNLTRCHIQFLKRRNLDVKKNDERLEILIVIRSKRQQRRVTLSAE